MNLQQSIENQTSASLILAKAVSDQHGKDKNLVFSPLSINVVLGLIAAGSTGPTLDQLLSFLKSDSAVDFHSLSSQLVSLILSDGAPAGGPQLSFANGVWVDRSLSLKDSFKQVAESDYKAALDSVDFQTKAIEIRNQVNLWAEKETNGLIKEVLPSGFSP